MSETIIENFFIKMTGFKPKLGGGSVVKKPGLPSRPPPPKAIPPPKATTPPKTHPDGPDQPNRPRTDGPDQPNRPHTDGPDGPSKPRSDGPDQPRGPTNVPDSGGGGGFGGMSMSDMLSLAGVGLMAYSIFGMGSPPVQETAAPVDESYTDPSLTDPNSTDPNSTDPNSTGQNPTSETKYPQLSANAAFLKSPAGTNKTDYTVYFKLFLLIVFILIIVVLIYKYFNRNTEEEDS